MLGGADVQGVEERDREETKRKALEQRPCQAIGLNIIRKKKGEPRVNAPLCSPLAHRPVPADSRLYI